MLKANTRKQAEKIVQAIQRRFPFAKLKIIGSLAESARSGHDMDVALQAVNLSLLALDQELKQFGLIYRDRTGTGWVYYDKSTFVQLDLFIYPLSLRRKLARYKAL